MNFVDEFIEYKKSLERELKNVSELFIAEVSQESLKLSQWRQDLHKKGWSIFFKVYYLKNGEIKELKIERIRYWDYEGNDCFFYYGWASREEKIKRFLDELSAWLFNYKGKFKFKLMSN